MNCAYAAGIRITARHSLFVERRLTFLCFTKTEHYIAHHSCYTVSQFIHVQKFIEPENWPPIVWI